MFSKSRIWIAATLTLALLVAGVSVATASTKSATAASAHSFRIVLSNNFTGNEWRIEMQNIAKAMASSNAPFKGNVNLQIVDAQGTTTGQIQSLNDIIATRPNAILLDSSSPTALNPVVQKACNAGIVVVTFDQIANAPCAYKVAANNLALFTANAEWLAKTLHGKGSLAQDLGLSGAPVSEYSHQAAAAVFKKYPGIKITATYDGGYAPGPSDQGVSAILASGKTINGLFGVAGVYGAEQAFLSAKAPLVPGVNFGDTSPNLLALVHQDKSKGLQFQFADNPPSLSGYALEVAYQLLAKKSPVVWGLKMGAHKMLTIPVQVYNTNGIKEPGVTVLPYTVLYKKYKNLPASTELPFSIPQSPVTSKEALGG